MQLRKRDNGDAGFLAGNAQQGVAHEQFICPHLQHPLLTGQVEVAYGSLLGNATQVVLMLAAGSLQTLVFHPFLPSEGIVAQQGMAIAYQQRTRHELAGIA